MIHAALTFSLAVFVTSLGAQSVLRIYDGTEPSQRFGSQVRGVDDVDNDGCTDVLVVSSRLQDFAQVLSSRTGEVFYGFDAPGISNPGAFAVVGDVSGDSISDIAYVAIQSGLVVVLRVRSGKDGALVRDIPLSRGVPGPFRVAAVGDIDNDAIDDIAVSGSTFSFGPMSGIQQLFAILSGTDGSAIWCANLAPGDGLAGVGDVSGDGVPDLAIGFRLANNGGGQIIILSGATGESLREIEGSPGEQIGWFIAPRVGDLNGDGFPELVVAGTSFNRVYSGASLTPLYSDLPAGTIAAIDDWDADGVRDLVVGMPGAWGCFNPPPPSANPGRVEVYSGATGTPIFALDGPGVCGRFGWSVADVPNIDGDGRPGIAVGAPWEDVGSALAAGTVRLIYYGRYRGSEEDLHLDVGENSVDRLEPDVRSFPAGGILALHLSSPLQSRVGRIPIIGMEFVASSALSTPSAAPPGLQLSPVSAILVFNGGAGPTPQVLGPSGLSFAMVLGSLPAAVAGNSAIAQGFVIDPTAANGIFASSSGIELVLQ